MPEIDRMVDIALSIEGVVGAHPAGAGLGGCMMVLAHKEAVSALIENLKQSYYAPCDKPPSIMLCKPITGSGMLPADKRD